MWLPRRINHVGMAVPSIQEFLAKNEVIYGGFEQGGLIVNETQRVSEVFLRHGHHVVELLEPLGDDSPISGFLRKNPGGGLVHIAFDVPQIDEAVAAVERGGGRLISGPIPDIAFDQRRIAFVFLHGQVVELIEEG